MTLAVLQVPVRNTAAPPLKSIVSLAFAPIQPNVIPVTAGTSRNYASFDPIARGERYWLGGVATSTSLVRYLYCVPKYWRISKRDNSAGLPLTSDKQCDLQHIRDSASYGNVTKRTAEFVTLSHKSLATR